MVLARKDRVAQAKQPAGEVTEMAHGWPTQGEPGGAGTEGEVPRAVFIPHANSLPFDERCVSLEQPVKIGRNVYRAAPSPTNAIFECRVLSRHHATLWYEKGHFYITDNQSSNGTFINNNRCSIGKDNEPHEVFSGDVLQFGIAVVENQTNQEKNTFLPVVALLKLYHPDGKEAKLTFNPAMTTPLHLKELYQLNNFIQEAVSREASLESRLRTLRECVERTRAEALQSWDLLVGEQRLLARVHALEATVAAGKPVTDTNMQRLLRDKSDYQEAAQESLRQAHEQRLALEEALEKKSREANSLRQQNCNLRVTANHALAELQKLAARCERKICAAKIAIATAEEREAATRARLPLAVMHTGEGMRMLVLSRDTRAAEPDSLAAALRALPDYIKLLLPDSVLAQVGLKAINIDAKSATECELILNKSDSTETETKDKRASLEESVLGWLQDNCRKEEAPLIVDEKNGVDHDSPEHNTTVLESEHNSVAADNNANSTFRRLENHNDASSKIKNQQDFNNWMTVVRGLKEEVTSLRSEMVDLAEDNEKLRFVRDKLVGIKLELEEEINERIMLERAAGEAESDPDCEKHDPESHKELAARLERALANQEALASQLASRPSQNDIGNLTLKCQTLQEQLQEREQLLNELRQTPTCSTTTLTPTCDRAINTCDGEDLDELSALSELDEALGEFNCDESVDDEQIEVDQPQVDLDEVVRRLGDIQEDCIQENIEIDEMIVNERKKIVDEGENIVDEEEKMESDGKEKVEDGKGDSIEDGKGDSIEDGGREEMLEAAKSEAAELEAAAAAAAESSALLALQEELVRVKESWEAARAECARLQRASSADHKLQLLACGAAVLAAVLYALLYRYIS